MAKERMREKVELQVEAKPIQGNGLKEALSRLREIDVVLGRVNRGMQGMAAPVAFKKTATQIKKELEQAFRGKPVSLKPDEIARTLGLDIKAVRSFVTQAKGELGKLMSGGQFRSMAGASRFFARFTAQQYRAQAAAQQFATRAMGGGPPGGGLKEALSRPSEVKAVLTGPVTLEIPGSMVKAVLVGPVQATGTMAAGSGGTPAGAGTVAGPGAPRIGGTAAPASVANELRRRITDARGKITTEITSAISALETLTESYGPKDADGPGKTVRNLKSGDRQIQKARQQLKQIRETLAADTATMFTGVRSDDLRSEAVLRGVAASGIEKAAKSAGLSKLGQGALEDEMMAKAAKQRALADKADKASRLARAREDAARERKAAAEKKRQDKVIEDERKQRAAAEKQEAAEAAQQAKERGRRIKSVAATEMKAHKARTDYTKFWEMDTSRKAGEERLASLAASGFRETATRKGTVTGPKGTRETVSSVFTREAGGMRTAITATATLGKQGQVLGYSFSEATRAMRAARTEAGATGRDFFRNTAHVTAWAASVGALYGALGLARASLRSFAETGLQTARLSQVFSGVGGTAQKLRDDVLALAAANGRSTEEALDSAIRWSRLGLTRAQVNEAVRVSLMAANVAELDAGVATEKLTAVMAAYQLRVVDLAGVLGQLNQISNTYNVTNADLLEGLSRTASVAKQAGIPLAELTGLIGAAVGVTGQTGANIGNAVKSLTVSLSNPAIQEFLKKQFNLDVKTDGGAEIKDMSTILGELWVRYQELTNAERQHLLVQVAGKTQASRVAALLDSYVQGQMLAVNAQLNLNSAEVENAKIKATLINQLRGVRTEWERLVAIQGNMGGGQALIEMTQALRNALAVLNMQGVNVALGIVLALMTALAARMALTAARMKEFSASTGFAARSLQRVKSSLAAMDMVFKRVTDDFKNATASAYGLGRALGLRLAASADFVAKSFLFLGRALKTAFIGFLSFLPQVLVFAGGIWAFNTAMDAIGKSSANAERKLAGFNAEAQKSRAAAEAASQSAKLLSNVGRALPNLADRSGTLDILRKGNVLTAAQTERVESLVKEGRILEANQVLEARRMELLREAAIFRQLEFESMEKQIQAQRAEVARLKGSPGASEKQILEAQAMLAELQGKRTATLIEETTAQNEQYDRVLDDDDRHQANLERQRLILESIAAIYSDLNTASNVDRMTASIAGAEARIKLLQFDDKAAVREDKATAERDVARKKRREQLGAKLKAQRQEFMALNAMDPEVADDAFVEVQVLEKKLTKNNAQDPKDIPGRSRRSQIQEAIKKAQAELAGLKGALAMEIKRQDVAIAQSMAESEGFGIGANSTEQLINRRRRLLELSREKEARAKSPDSTELQRDNARIGLRQHLVDLQKVELDLVKQRYALEKEEGDLIRQNLTEVQRMLMRGSPSDLLRTLAASRMTSRGMSSGQFLSMSPQMREAAGNMDPRFSPEVADRRRQREMLGPPKWLEDLQREQENHSASISRITQQLNFSGADAELFRKAAEVQEMNKFTQQVGGATAALARLEGQVTRLAGVVERLANGQGGGNPGMAPPHLPDATGWMPGT